MSKRLWSSTFAAIVCTATVALVAQSSTPQTPSSSSAAGMADKVTVTGCIQRAPTPGGATGTTGTTASSSPGFVLNNASSDSSSTSSRSAGGATASTYRLDGDDTKLTPHVGHKVEITGSLENSRMGSSSSAGGAGAAGAGSSSPSSMRSPQLKVDSIKMVSASCAE